MFVIPPHINNFKGHVLEKGDENNCNQIGYYLIDFVLLKDNLGLRQTRKGGHGLFDSSQKSIRLCREVDRVQPIFSPYQYALLGYLRF